MATAPRSYYWLWTITNMAGYSLLIYLLNMKLADILMNFLVGQEYIEVPVYRKAEVQVSQFRTI